MLTINGHGLGRVPDCADPRDHIYAPIHSYGAALPPPSIDLRKHLPPVWDQGSTSSCGGQSGAALMSFLYPEVGGFSALQIYYSVRVLEKDPTEDAGVETRDVLKVLKDIGAAPASNFPFDPSKVLVQPSESVISEASKYKISNYSRLISSDDYINCLSSGFPFILGFMVPESLDGDLVNKTGIMPIPNLSKEKLVGGHDVLVVGYDRTFKKTPFFESTGMDPTEVDDTMLLVRNSWGPKWSPKFRGHFWMPLSYAINPSTGGDAWTARVTSPSKRMASPLVNKPIPTHAQFLAAFSACRTAINATGYGGWVSDEKLRPISDAVATAVIQA